MFSFCTCLAVASALLSLLGETSASGAIETRANDANDDFIFPPPTGQMGPNNSVFTIGSLLNLTWKTTYSRVDLGLYQQPVGAPANGVYFIGTNLESKSYAWTVTAANFDLSTADTFFFRVFDKDSSEIFGSSYMNFTIGAVATLGFASSTASATSQPSTLSTSTTSSTSTSTSTSSPSPSASPQSSSGLSTGAKIGIGVGVGVVALAFVIAGSIWLWCARGCCGKGRRTGTNMVSQSELPDSHIQPPSELPSSDPLMSEQKNKGRSTEFHEMGT